MIYLIGFVGLTTIISIFLFLIIERENEELTNHEWCIKHDNLYYNCIIEEWFEK